MKKVLMIFMMALVMILAACSSTNDEKSGKGVEDKVEEAEKVEKEEDGAISLQLLKIDEEAGATLDTHPLYIELNEMIQEAPELGIPDDFSIEVIDIVDSGTEDAALMFLAINRTPAALTNISFDYTLGHENGEFVWKDFEVELTEEEAGVIQPNHAMPFSLGITAEQEALIDIINYDNKVMELNNADVEIVK